MHEQQCVARATGFTLDLITCPTQVTVGSGDDQIFPDSTHPLSPRFLKTSVIYMGKKTFSIKDLIRVEAPGLLHTVFYANESSIADKRVLMFYLVPS